MKQLLQYIFLPQYYQQILFSQYENCQQGNRSIAFYNEKSY